MLMVRDAAAERVLKIGETFPLSEDELKAFMPRPKPKPSGPLVWHVLLTELNRERQAASGFVGRSFGGRVHLPLFWRERVVTGRVSFECKGPRRARPRREHAELLMPGYLFLELPALSGLDASPDAPDIYHLVRAVAGVRDFMRDGERYGTVPGPVMGEIYAYEAAQAAKAVMARRGGEARFKLGQEVRAKGSAFELFTYRVTRLDARGRVKAARDFMGRVVEFDFDASLLEAV